MNTSPFAYLQEHDASSPPRLPDVPQASEPSQELARATRIRRQVLVPVWAVLSVLALAFLGWFRLHNDWQEERETRLITHQAQVMWKNLLAEDVALLHKMLDEIEEQEPFARAFPLDDREQLWRDFVPTLRRLRTSHDITHLYFMAPDRTCFLRVHEPGRFGDRIQRITMRQAAETGQDAYGMEVGPLGTCTLRYVHPHKIQGELVGFVEVGMELSGLAEQIRQNLGTDMIVALHKEITTREGFEAGKRANLCYGNWDDLAEAVVIGHTTRDIPHGLADHVGPSHSDQSDTIFSLHDAQHSWSCHTMPIADASGRIVADLVFLRDMTAVVAEQRWVYVSALLSVGGLGAIVMLVLGRLTGKVERRLVTALVARQQAEGRLLEYLKALESTNQALVEATRTAQAAARTKSEFLANMSHEIRTPMTAILGYTDVLAETLQEPDQQETVAIIRRNGQHLLGLINDILDASKIEAGQLQAEQTSCSPREIIDDVIALMRGQAASKGLSLTLEYLSPIPATIRTDPRRFRQILVNLVGNALKFTEQGEVRLTVRVLDREGPQPRLECVVRDTGLGIPADRLQAIFHPFQQADSSTTRRFGGTGLGLAISLRLARLLQGDLTVQSTPGQGSTFTVTLGTGPLHGIPFLEHPETAPPPAPAAPPGPVTLPRVCQVLLAEDAPDSQRLIALLLRKAGAEVTLAGNGQEALEQVQARTSAALPAFDLILMDMQMPILDGYEATRQLRAGGYRGPIVALTAHALAEEQQKCLDAGCDDFATKPIDRGTLLALVARFTAAATPTDSTHAAPGVV